jgi:hypothetical protein
MSGARFPALSSRAAPRRSLDGREAGGPSGDPSYALRRFDNEARRIHGVTNLALFNKRHLAAGQYTIPDWICYSWVSSWATRGIDIDEFPT